MYRTSVRTLWDWLPVSLRKLYHVGLLSALVISLPGLMLVGWYVWGTLATHQRYNRAGEGQEQLTAELFHIHLHDLLRRDLRRLVSPAPARRSRVAIYDLMVDRVQLSRLTDTYVEEGDRPYIPATLETDGTMLDVELRLRGTRHWHWNYPQKSLKVRITSTGLLEDCRVFNLVNEVTPLGIGEQVVMDLTREFGILTPSYHPARVRINGQHMGLYYFLAQPEEALLRREDRVPGSLLSGNDGVVDPETGQSLLFQDPTQWKEVADAKGEPGEDLSQIERLLHMLREAPALEFVDYATHELDLERLATLDALDVIFGIDQHDFDQNHKLYFDPYRGRCEPIAWNMRGWKHEPRFHLVQSPISLRLGLLPDYVALRNRTLHELLLGPCSISALRQRLRETLRDVAQELRSDPYWDAYKLLPEASPYLRRMVRPMNERRQALVLASELATYATRHAFLLEQLEATRVQARAGAWEDGTVPVLVEVEGHAGYRLEGCRLQVEHPDPGPWTFHADLNRDGRLESGSDIQVIRAEASYGEASVRWIELHPLARVCARPEPSESAGDVDLEPVPGRYLFHLQCQAPPSSITLRLRNLITDSLISVAMTPGTLSPGELTPPAGGGMGLQPGATSLHPWTAPPPRRPTTQLGPGEVHVTATRVFGREETLVVHPGTELLMDEGVSLICLGPVRMQGTAQHPISIMPSGPGVTWGGVALQGPGTAGSVVEQVILRGGSTPTWRLVTYPGVLCIHDTHGVTLRRLRIQDLAPGADAIHGAYLEDLLVEDCTLVRPPGDAMDLEFVQGIIRSCAVHAAAEDGLDTMGSRLLVQDCIVVGCLDNGVSVGQRSRVELRGCLVAGGARGGLVKSASTLRLASSLFYRCQVGLRLEAREVLYSGPSRLESDAVYCVLTERPLEAPADARVDLERISRKLPTNHHLDHLLSDVLALESWEEVQAWLDRELGDE